MFQSHFWGRGFRPFFLLGALYAVAMVFAWMFFVKSGVSLPMAWGANPVLWHAHEMIYGFTVAIIAGFLLTAVANWTGSKPVRHGNLALLCLVWIAGRVAFWGGALSGWLVSTVDLAFLPLLAVSLSIPLIRTKNNHNFMFIGILGLLFLGNLHMHMAVNGIIDVDPRVTAYAVIMVVMAIISIVSSRIIPSFTVAGLRMRGLNVYQVVQAKTDVAAMLSLVLLAFLIIFTGIDSKPVGIAAFVSGGLHIWRMRVWHSARVWHEPMLWILHLGHAWLFAGLFALASHALGLLENPSMAMHMLTVGCIGSLTIGMMARVALGHTGRQIVAGRGTVISFMLMQAAAFIRSFAFVIPGVDYTAWVFASGILWVCAFVIYTVSYAPVLLKPRPDGAEA